MNIWKRAFRFALVLLPISLAAGVLVTFYQADLYPEEQLDPAIAQLGGIGVLAAITAVQAALYAFVCGLFGCVLAEKMGLWRPFRLEKRPLLQTVVLTVLFGILFSLDYWVFGGLHPAIRESVPAGLKPMGFAAAVLYGGVVEELMMRLFLMTLLAWLLRLAFCRKAKDKPAPVWVFVTANAIAALLFAAGHLPATLVTFGALTAPILFRCFLLNGSFGLFFGWLYRKYGIAYAMLAHAGLHIVSKVIWLIFT